MSAPAPRASRFTRAAELTLALLLLFGCLALASAPTWALAPSVALAGIACVLSTLGARAEGRSLHLPAFTVLLVLSACAISLQLIPLPLGLSRVLSPRGAEVVDVVLAPLGLSTARPISLDPPATWRALGLALASVLVFVTAAQLARRDGARHRLGMGLALFAASLPLLGALHWLAGTERLFGLYRFQVTPPAVLTPFGNPNHLAGFLGLGAALALGAARSRFVRGRLRPVLWGAWAVASAGVFASRSLGGVLAWTLGQLTFVALTWRAQRSVPVSSRQGRGERTRARLEAPALLLALLLLFGLGLSALRPLEKELLDTASVEGLGASKLELLPGFFRMALEVPWVGVGRGAFEAAWPRFAAEARGDTFTHPENGPLQWATELGLPLGGGLLVAVLVTFAWLLSRRRMQSLQLGALAGLTGLCLQNLVDFSLELPFLAFAALVSLALAWGPPVRSDDVPDRRRTALTLHLTRVGPILTGGLAVVALIAVLGPGRSTLDGASQTVRTAFEAGRPAPELRALAIAAIDRHPTHWALQTLAAEALARTAPADALAFVNRALFLHPHHGPTHRAAARALLRLGAREQAFVEYRLAARGRDPGAVAEALTHAKTTAEHVSLTPDLARARTIARGLRPAASALAYLEQVPFRFPDAEGLELARLSLDAARIHLADGDVKRAADAGALASRLAPGTLETELGRARLLRAMGEQQAAQTLLQELWAAHPGPDVGFFLVEAALSAKALRPARSALQQTRPFLRSFEERARWLELEAQAHDLAGAFHRGVVSRKSACRLTPSTACWYRLARAYERMKDPVQARDAVRAGVRLLRGEPPAAIQAWLTSLESQVESQRALEASEAGNPSQLGTEDLLRRIGGPSRAGHGSPPGDNSESP